jgi:hypothetical protein
LLEGLVAQGFGVGWSLKSERSTEEEATMADDRTDLGQVIRIQDNVVRGSVEETLNAMLGAEAERLCTAGRTKNAPSKVVYFRSSVRGAINTEHVDEP